jgi:transposase
MDSAALSLPNNTDQLKAEVIQLRNIVKKKERTIDEKKQRIEQLLDYILLLRKRQFAPTSEQFNKDQLNLFDEAELEQLMEDLDFPTDQDEVTEPAQEQEKSDKKKPVRRPLPKHFNRVEKIIDLSDEEKAAMGNDWVFIGYDTSEQLAVIPRQHYVIEYKRAKYAPKNDNITGAEQGVIIAPRADQIIPKSIAHSSVIADVVIRKFVDALPFYRQEKIYAREGVDLSRQTMSGWVIQLNEKLSPLMQLMKRQLYGGKVLHIDETRLQVLNEPGKENTQLSYIWVYVGGPPDKPVVWHQYADNRGGHVPMDFLYPEKESDDAIDPDWSVTIMTDGYSGYNALSAMPGIKGHAACWAHVRRKFVDAAAGRKNQAAAHQMVALIGKLYLIERSAKDKTPEERKEIRQSLSQPILDKIKTWLDSKAGKVLPKSLLGKAIHYALGLWPQLIIYVDDSNIPIDNNPAENAVRPFVIGRKNWLFSGSPRGAHASATLYTLVETAKANHLEPWAYLNYLFERLPTAKSEQALRALMPQNLKMEDLNG